MDFQIISLITSFIAFFLALSVHEFSHALLAYYYGDYTAKNAGRLTLNPLAHIDLFGTIILPLFLILSNAGIVFGWAKPVPVNYYNLKNPRWGSAIVSLAGPFANLLFGIFCVIFFVILSKFSGLSTDNLLISFIINLAFVNFILMVFNLIPLPPLDGSKVLFAILPDNLAFVSDFLEKYGIIILIGLLLIGIDFVFVISQSIFLHFINFIEIFI